MSWGVDANVVCGSTRIGNFFVFNSTLYLNAHGTYLYERTGPGTWTAVQESGFQLYNGMVWNGYLWAARSNDIYRTTDGTNWILDLDVPATWGGFYTTRGYGGYGNYMYLANREWLDPVDSIMHFARRDTLGNWTNDVLTQFEVLTGASPTTQIIPYGSYVFWTSADNRWGDQIWNGSSWSAGPLTLTYTRYIIFNNLLFACGCASRIDPTKEGIFRWTGSQWYEETQINSSLHGYLSIGDDGELYYGCGMTGAEIYARNNGRWTLVGRDVGGVDATAGTVFDGTMYYLENATVNQDIYILSDSYVADPTGNGLSPQALACDGNGDSLYIGLYDNSNNPIAVKAVLPLGDLAGALIYNPGAGDAINVATSEYVGDYVIFSGYFGTDIQTQQSTDGGATLTLINPNTWDDNRAQPVVVDPNDEGHILVALHTLDDLMEYTGSGTAWTTLDAALAFDVGAMAMYDLNPDEIFIGRDAAGADVILYSPNSATDWENITLLMTAPGAIASIEIV